MLEIDDVTLWMGEPYVINDKIKVFQPNLRQVFEFGERQYFSVVQTLCSTSSNMKAQLADMNLNWETIEDFQMFMMLAPTLGQDKTKLVLGDIEEYVPSFTKRERDWVLNSAEEWYNYQEQHTYHEMNWPPNHGFFMYTSWGIGHPEQRGRAFIYAWLVTGDTKFRDASYLIMDNSMGCNAIGRTATTGLGVVAPIHHLDSWLPRAEMEWNQHEPVPGISPYGIIGFNSAAVPYGYCMYQQARGDMGFPELLRNILPMGYSKTVGHNRGLVAQWMEKRWPIWRNLFEAESYNVAQSEFTIWETICGKAFMCGCLMTPGYVPDETIKNKAPSTDQYAVEGLIYLP